MNTRLARYPGWAAYITGIMSVFGLVTLILFFSIEAPQVSANPQGFHIWGPLSDIAGPLTMLPLLLVILALHQITQAGAPLLSRVAAAIGVGGALAVTILQVLLIVHVLSFEQEVGPVVWATAGVGVWLVLANHLGRLQHVLPSGLAWLGIVVGLAEIAYPVLFQILGGARFYENIGSNYVVLTVTAFIFLVSYIGFPIWAIWLGRVWARRGKTAKAGVAYAG